MKIIRSDIEPEFTPMNLTISVESREDYEVLMNLTRRDEIVPEVIRNHGGSYIDCKNFLQALRRALTHANR